MKHPPFNATRPPSKNKDTMTREGANSLVCELTAKILLFMQPLLARINHKSDLLLIVQLVDQLPDI